MAHGKGQLNDPANGSAIYSGEFHRGWFNGWGTGRVFEEIAGVVSFVGVYKGQWAFGYRHGVGELVDPAGSTYVGEWRVRLGAYTHTRTHAKLA